jgi:hypothetical protein
MLTDCHRERALGQKGIVCVPSRAQNNVNGKKEERKVSYLQWLFGVDSQCPNAMFGMPQLYNILGKRLVGGALFSGGELCIGHGTLWLAECSFALG